LETFEGITAVEEAMRFLSVQKPVPKLALSEELSKAAKDHALDIGENNLFGHEGSDKSMLSDRIERYTEWDESCAESIDLGFKNADNIILNLLIDDGSEGRNQRRNLFNTTYKYIGIGCAFHKSYNHCAVFVYAKSLRELGVAPSVGINFMQGNDVIFDREKKSIGIVPANCARQNLISTAQKGVETKGKTNLVTGKKEKVQNAKSGENEDFLTLKMEGNTYMQDKQYLKAIKRYTTALSKLFLFIFKGL